MANIIGVKFRSRGKLFYCGAYELVLQLNDYVVVDTGHGLDVAKVVTLEAPSQLDEQLIKVMRPASPEDLEESRRNVEEESLSKCHVMGAQLGLKMKPLAARYDVQKEQMTIFFSAA